MADGTEAYLGFRLAIGKAMLRCRVLRSSDISDDELIEWLDVLPDRIVALEEKIERLREAVALLNSMVLSGESHSEHSQAVVRAALERA